MQHSHGAGTTSTNQRGTLCSLKGKTQGKVKTLTLPMKLSCWELKVIIESDLDVCILTFLSAPLFSYREDRSWTRCQWVNLKWNCKVRVTKTGHTRRKWHLFWHVYVVVFQQVCHYLWELHVTRVHVTTLKCLHAKIRTLQKTKNAHSHAGLILGARHNVSMCWQPPFLTLLLPPPTAAVQPMWKREAHPTRLHSLWSGRRTRGKKH